MLSAFFPGNHTFYNGLAYVDQGFDVDVVCPKQQKQTKKRLKKFSELPGLKKIFFKNFRPELFFRQFQPKIFFFPNFNA